MPDGADGVGISSGDNSHFCVAATHNACSIHRTASACKCSRDSSFWDPCATLTSPRPSTESPGSYSSYMNHTVYTHCTTLKNRRNQQCSKDSTTPRNTSGRPRPASPRKSFGTCVQSISICKSYNASRFLLQQRFSAGLIYRLQGTSISTEILLNLRAVYHQIIQCIAKVPFAAKVLCGAHL